MTALVCYVFHPSVTDQDTDQQASWLAGGRFTVLSRVLVNWYLNAIDQRAKQLILPPGLQGSGLTALLCLYELQSPPAL